MEKLKGENMKMEEDIGLSDRHLMYIGVFGLIFGLMVISAVCIFSDFIFRFWAFFVK